MKKFWFIKIILFVAVAIFALSVLVMLLWNNLIPVLFNGPAITYVQALGLLVLCKILFGSFKGGRGGHHWRGHNWREKWEDKWKTMTPDQREEMKRKWKDRCGRWGAPAPFPSAEEGKVNEG